MVDHLYSPQMSDILVRLLNFNKTQNSKASPTSDNFNENTAQEIRQCTIFSIIQRIGTGYSFDS